MRASSMSSSASGTKSADRNGSRPEEEPRAAEVGAAGSGAGGLLGYSSGQEGAGPEEWPERSPIAVEIDDRAVGSWIEAPLEYLSGTQEDSEVRDGDGLSDSREQQGRSEAPQPRGEERCRDDTYIDTRGGMGPSWGSI